MHRFDIFLDSNKYLEDLRQELNDFACAHQEPNKAIPHPVTNNALRIDIVNLASVINLNTLLDAHIDHANLGIDRYCVEQIDAKKVVRPKTRPSFLSVVKTGNGTN